MGDAAFLVVLLSVVGVMVFGNFVMVVTIWSSKKQYIRVEWWWFGLHSTTLIGN